MMASRTLTAGRAASPERWQRAAQRARKLGIEVRRIAGTEQWVASSGSDPGRAYLLAIVDGEAVGCSCEAATVWLDECCSHRAAWRLAHGLIALPGAGEDG